MMLYCVYVCIEKTDKCSISCSRVSSSSVLFVQAFCVPPSLPPPPLSKYIINMSVYSSPAPVNFVLEGIKSCILFHSLFQTPGKL